MTLRPGLTQEAHSFSLDTLAQALAPAGGTITCDTNAAGADGDIVTVSDGINPAVVYEYDKASDGVTGGRVSWAVGTTAASNATALAALIVANQPAIAVSDNLAGVLTLTHKFPGRGGNVTITKSGNVVSAVTGMTGGCSGPIEATTTLRFAKIPRDFRLSTVELSVPVGFTADASAYWTIAIKNGSTVVASWSTQTTGGSPGGQGALTANTPVTMTNNATDANLVFAAGDTPTLVVTKTGSPSSLPLARVSAHGKFVS